MYVDCIIKQLQCIHMSCISIWFACAWFIYIQFTSTMHVYYIASHVHAQLAHITCVIYVRCIALHVKLDIYITFASLFHSHCDHTMHNSTYLNISSYAHTTVNMYGINWEILVMSLTELQVSSWKWVFAEYVQMSVYYEVIICWLVKHQCYQSNLRWHSQYRPPEKQILATQTNNTKHIFSTSLEWMVKHVAHVRNTKP